MHLIQWFKLLKLYTSANDSIALLVHSLDILSLFVSYELLTSIHQALLIFSMQCLLDFLSTHIVYLSVGF